MVEEQLAAGGEEPAAEKGDEEWALGDGRQTWAADSSWLADRPRGFWTRRATSVYLDHRPWEGMDRENDEAARERLLEVLLTFRVGGSRAQRYPRRNPPFRGASSGSPTLRDLAEELGVKKVAQHGWPEAVGGKGAKPDICAKLCALASSGREWEQRLAAWLRRERERQAQQEQRRRRMLAAFVAPPTLAAFVEHGYDPAHAASTPSRSDAAASSEAGVHEQLRLRHMATVREMVKLRQVNTAFRAAVDCDAVWEVHYRAFSAGKHFIPPTISRTVGRPDAADGADASRMVGRPYAAGAADAAGAVDDAAAAARGRRLPHLEAVRLAAAEHARGVVTADDLCEAEFHSRARYLPHAATVTQLASACPWWRNEAPRRHRFGRDNILRSYTVESTGSAGSTVVERRVGPWRIVAAPAGLRPDATYVCTYGRVCIVWQVRRTACWDILLVAAGHIKSTSPLRAKEDDVGAVEARFVLSAEEEAALWAADDAMEAARQEQAESVYQYT